MLSEQQVKAAALTAQGKSSTDCATAVGVCKKTILRWRQLPEFRVRAEEEHAELRKKIRTTGAAVKEVRIKAKKRRLAALYRILRKRAGNALAGGAEWDDTGFMVRREVCVGGGKYGTFTVEYELDKGMLDAILDVENSIADELGERHKVIDHHLRMFDRAPGDKSVQLASVLDVDQITALLALIGDDESAGEAASGPAGKTDGGAEEATREPDGDGPGAAAGPGHPEAQQT
ncbi:MAG TPA: hypothetical protein VKT75_10630 [Acidobacteriaceae bacterium]|nr:hypothetical protein [Acidobacteriaceae bacterium]